MKILYLNNWWSLTNYCNITSDWCLIVQRGIPCEDHNQIFSHHVTNSPSYETVKEYIEFHNDKINDKINKFVDLARVMKSETISNEFCYLLLKTIIEECEKIEDARRT